jgi:hypothetical protein
MAGESSTARGALARDTDSGDATTAQPPALVFRVDTGTGQCVPLSESGPAMAAGALVVLAGDYFTESNFDGSLRSARYAAKAIIAAL